MNIKIKEFRMSEYEEEIKKNLLNTLKNLKNKCVYELIKSDKKHIEIWDNEIIPYKPIISIFQHIQIDKNETKELYKFIEKNKGIDWFTNVKDFFKHEKINCISGNTYNGEHNLTHDFQYYIYTKHRKDDIDYYNEEDIYIIILFHYTGDIRSNYCKPIICTPQPYSTLTDMFIEMTDVLLYDSNDEQYIMQATILYKNDTEIEHQELINRGITDIA